MNIQSRLSGHWTDEQIIEHLYGGGPENDHLTSCPDCLSRLSSLREHRQGVEEASGTNEASNEFLNDQRRQIYARLSKQAHSAKLPAGFTRWVSAAAMLLVVGGSVFFVEEHRQPKWNQPAVPHVTISDAQLASEVSQMADASEPESTEPLQALFAEE